MCGPGTQCGVGVWSQGRTSGAPKDHVGSHRQPAFVIQCAYLRPEKEWITRVFYAFQELLVSLVLVLPGVALPLSLSRVVVVVVAIVVPLDIGSGSCSAHACLGGPVMLSAKILIKNRRK
ncbi:hypothetical protein NDU88_007274 [Pleurodeles waltl]|uniref:Uncharacterized protein n=1 Tax=Pleurodeles waltl TaxID=8319 RepID=A0AAV7VS17_PLEWA|nr:hypothetical protein NDU88_007274 [Pleurodeles waltl]